MEPFQPPQTPAALRRETALLLALCVAGILVLFVLTYCLST